MCIWEREKANLQPQVSREVIFIAHLKYHFHMADHKLHEDNVGQTSNGLKAQVLEGLLMPSYDDINRDIFIKEHKNIWRSTKKNKG